MEPKGSLPCYQEPVIQLLIVCLPPSHQSSPPCFSLHLFIYLFLLYFTFFLLIHRHVPCYVQSNISFLFFVHYPVHFSSIASAAVPTCSSSFIYFLIIHKQLLHRCKNWKTMWKD